MRQPARRPGEQLPRPPSATAPARTRARRQNGHQLCPIQSEIDVVPPSGKPIGLTTKRASRKRPNPLSEPNFSWSCFVAVCIIRPVQFCASQRVSPPPRAGLSALKSRRSGTRKTRTKFALRSQAVAPTTWNPKGQPEPSPMPSICQSPTYRKGAIFPMTMTTASLPPLPRARPPPA